jgi:hypothetical protein
MVFGAVLFGGKILQSHNMQRINKGNLLIFVENGQACSANEHNFRMKDRVLLAVGRAQCEGLKTPSSNPLSNTRQVHF